VLQNTTPTPIAPSGLGGAQSVLLPVTRVQQAVSNWCWAACGEMIGRFLGLPGIDQCTLANSYLAGTGNCADACKDSSNCNSPCLYTDIEALYSKVGIACCFVQGPLKFSAVNDEIVNNRQPVLAMLSFGLGFNHFLLVTGCSSSGSVYGIDSRPGYGEGWMTYATLLSAHGYGAWTSSWTGVGKTS
jgi:Papain-like cysteine protease AvrRpt2